MILSLVAIAASFHTVLAGKLLFLVIPVRYSFHPLVDVVWQGRVQRAELDQS
jgi:hypothetical protein